MDMSDRIKEMFVKSFLLKEADDDVFRDRTVDDGDAFEGGLDRGSDAGDFETDGLGFDATSSQEDRFVDAYQQIEGLGRTIDNLIDPDTGGGSLLRLMAELDTNASIAKGGADRIRKDAKKAADSLSSIINEMKTIASMEPSLRRKIGAINNQG